MASKCCLLDLPDLVLHNICKFITCPIDLLHFGNTCSRLRDLSSSENLWWTIAFRWCKGLWIFLKESPDSEDPREWMLCIIKQYTRLPNGTKSECFFSNGEKWERSESRKFRFLFGLLHLVYKREQNEHPALQFQEWLYDIGLYRRIGPTIDYTVESFQFHHDDILQLSTLGQAKDRVLQRVEHPHKDSACYIKEIATADANWLSLFPSDLHGSICPLLLDPRRNCPTYEKYSMEGLIVCLSLVLEKRIEAQSKTLKLPINTIFKWISIFCMYFVVEVVRTLPNFNFRNMQLGSETQPLKSAVLRLIAENYIMTDSLQDMLDQHEINISCKDILHEFSDFLRNCRGIDFVVEEVQMRIRKAIIEEINKILFPNPFEKNIVTRINITDYDLIGGDNAEQEMAAAAFISPYGVLVTWHHVGRMNY